MSTETLRSPSHAAAASGGSGAAVAGEAAAGAAAAGAGAVAGAGHHAVFVYGTLLRGFQNCTAVLRGRHAGPPVPARLRGARVVHLSELGYPALELTVEDDAASVVVGELLRGVPADALADLDALEEFTAPGAAGNVYERVVVRVRARAGAHEAEEDVAAFTYVLAPGGPLAGARRVPVPGGDWRAFMAASALSASADDPDAVRARRAARDAAVAAAALSTGSAAAAAALV